MSEKDYSLVTLVSIVFFELIITVSCGNQEQCSFPLVEEPHIQNTLCPVTQGNIPLCIEFDYLFHCDYNSTQWGLTYGYCLTLHSNNTGYNISACPYLIEPYPNHLKTVDHYYYVLPSNISKINSSVCEILNRKGPLCQSCIPKHGPSVFTFDLKCQKCHWYGLPLYLLLELVPITIFFLLVVTLHINIAVPPLTAFVMFYQAVANVVPSDPLIYNYAAGTCMPLLKAGLFFSGIWSLDFFRSFIPPFCVSDKLKNIDVYMLAYLSGLYPLLLVVIAYTLIEMHARNCRLLVWIWKPFGICCARLRRSWNLQSSIMNALATFLLLAYTKLLFVSFTILYPRELIEVTYTKNEYSTHTVLQMDPEVPFFGRTHIPYAMFSILVLIVFIFFPAFLLALYPTRFSGLFHCCCNQRRSHALRAFVECYQGSFKDGTGGTWDLRWVSSLYLFLRIILIAQFLAFQMKDWFEFAAYNEIIIIFAASLFILILQPYKSSTMNVLDSLILTLMGIICLALQAWRVHFFTLKSLSSDHLVWFGMFFLASLPYLALACYICYFCLKNHIIPWREKHYVIGEILSPSNEIFNREYEYSHLNRKING